jgi:hypothetical protein
MGSCFSSPNLHKRKIDHSLLRDQNMCFVFDAYSPMSLTDIHEIKCLSIIRIYTIWVPFVLPLPYIQFLQGVVIRGCQNIEGRRCSRDVGLDRQVSPPLRRSSQSCSLGIICNMTLFVLEIEYLKYCTILCYPRITSFCKQLVRFLLIRSPGFDIRLIIPFVVIFILPSYILRATIQCCYSSPYFSTFFASP